MFRRADMLASTFNTWAMEIDPDQTFVYELTRPDGRRFRVQFDLSQPVDLPPAPWDDEKAPQQGSDPGGSARTKARAAAVAHPHLPARIAPAAAFLAGTAGQLLLQHRPALAVIPVAGLRAVVVAAAGDRVVAVATAPAAAAAPAAGFGEFGAAAIADPDRAIAHAPGGHYASRPGSCARGCSGFRSGWCRPGGRCCRPSHRRGRRPSRHGTRRIRRGSRW
ncbi:hypothetical protein G6F57_017630 [Rhizopus arrhizus]|nr:hypothetical protein G6F57_017630 [Rhizopus arrhizus]